MRDRTVTINGLSKTYSVTGWRVGYILAPFELTTAIRKVHDFLTVGAPAPLQRAGVTAMKLPPTYYKNLAETYRAKRAFMTQLLEEVDVPYFQPKGSYYVLVDISQFGYTNSVEFTYYLIKEIGVAAVPASSFSSRAELGRSLIRFCFSKTPETLEAARAKLLKLRL
jgi:aminotransferase